MEISMTHITSNLPRDLIKARIDNLVRSIAVSTHEVDEKQKEVYSMVRDIQEMTFNKQSLEEALVKLNA